MPRPRKKFRSSINDDVRKISIRDLSDTEGTPTKASFEEETSASRRDRLEIQNVLTDQDDAITALEEESGLFKGYIHVEIDAGTATVIGRRGLSVNTVGVQVIISTDTPIVGAYSAIIHDQKDASFTHYWTNSRDQRGFMVQATDFAGAPVDLSVGTHAFAVQLLGTGSD